MIDIVEYAFIIVNKRHVNIVDTVINDRKKGGSVKYAVGLIVLFCLMLLACDQGQVAGAPDLTAPAKDFVEMLARGDYDGTFEQFDATMRGAMPVEQIEAAWGSLLAKTGGFNKIAGVRQAKEQGFDVVYVTCGFEKAQLDVKVVYNDKKEVSGLWFLPK